MSPQSSIGPYRITAKIGEGGMGAVYRATDTKLNREVALKVLPPEFAADTARIQRFEREAQLLAALNHPNIATIHGIESGAIVMELVEGETLPSPVPLETALNYALKGRVKGGPISSAVGNTPETRIVVNRDATVTPRFRDRT